MIPNYYLPASLRARAKWSLFLAYAVCPILLAISAYGFWQWFKLPANPQLLSTQELFFLMSLVILPVTLFLFLAAAAAQKLEHIRLSASYQIRLDQLQKRLNYQEDLLRAMTDHHPGAIVIFDQNNRYWFVNRRAAQDLGQNGGDIIGKDPSRLIGAERGRKLESRLKEVRASGRPIETLDEVTGDAGHVRFIQSHYESIAPFGDFSGGVMLREEDLTSLIIEREWRENMLRQVIGTLVAVVDRRDPYAAGHSARVGQLARAIAEEMVLSEKEIETAEIAGSLMNFGKVLVPREILTKSSALTPDELQRIRESILTSADILSIIDFVGPVVPTLRQVLERYDGTGAPEGLKGDQILATARIVTVANAYVALVSPRAHRPSMPFDKAIQHMMRDAGTIYDRSVVTALANYIENRADKLDWLTSTKLSA